jgi:spore germination protein YaaH
LISDIFNELIKYKKEITQLLSNNVLEKEKLKPVAMVKLGKKLNKCAIRALINKIVNTVLEEETAKPNF